jgi:hypothetical protein
VHIGLLSLVQLNAETSAWHLDADKTAGGVHSIIAGDALASLGFPRACGPRRT